MKKTRKNASRPLPPNAITDLTNRVYGSGVRRFGTGRPAKNIRVYEVADTMFNSQCIVLPIPEDFEGRGRNYAMVMRNGATDFCKPRPGYKISVWRTIHDGEEKVVIQWVSDSRGLVYASDVSRLMEADPNTPVFVSSPRWLELSRYLMRIRSHVYSKGLSVQGLPLRSLRIDKRKAVLWWGGAECPWNPEGGSPPLALENRDSSGRFTNNPE